MRQTAGRPGKNTPHESEVQNKQKRTDKIENPQAVIYLLVLMFYLI
jgi:hypothetical protein